MSGFIDLQDPDKPYACDRKYISFAFVLIFGLCYFKSLLHMVLTFFYNLKMQLTTAFLPILFKFVLNKYIIPKCMLC